MLDTGIPQGCKALRPYIAILKIALDTRSRFHGDKLRGNEGFFFITTKSQR